MKLNQDGIAPQDVKLAWSLRNYLINGNRVIGDPGEGLRQTLVKLEKIRDDRKVGITEWEVRDEDLEEQISKTKAGIEGEEQLCDYLTRLIKNDDKLKGLVAFASLSYDLGNNTKDYIPDTDTLLVYGNNLMIVDAKNIKTKASVPLMMVEGCIVDEKMNVLLECHPSTHIWRKIMDENGIQVDSITGYVCIVNNTDTEIIRTEDWEASQTRLIHVKELKDILEEWVKGKSNDLSLKMLTQIAKAQIRKQRTLSFDVAEIKRNFDV